MILRELATYLASAGIGTVGTDIFVGELPATPDNAILLVSSVSTPPDLYLDTLYLDMDIWSRNKSTKNGNDKLAAVFTLLQRNHHFQIGDYYIYFVHATGLVEDLDRDTEGRKLQRSSYRIIFRDTRTVS